MTSDLGGTSDASKTSSFGRYQLIERLGVGGMAEVFKAKSFGVEGFEKILVIKRILPELARSPDFVDMFIHEAKLAVRLSHANIVQVFDLGVAPGSAPEENAGAGAGESVDAYYMAMEFVHGFDLASLLARAKKHGAPLPISMCVFIAAEVCKGLDHAHRRRDEQMKPLGIVHRDVSPQNVLLSFEGEVKVTDFGIAKARGAAMPEALEDTRSRKLQGKFGYMSPEQARGENVDARSDLFSLGVILYECLAGANPFQAQTTFETLRRVQACEYPPLVLARPEVPPALLQILEKAMAASRDDRYGDAARMYEALLAFLYTHGSRYGAHDLAEFMARYREDDSSRAAPVSADDLAGDGPSALERTPVEAPAGRSAPPGPERSDSYIRFMAVDRAAELGERREVTALALELPRREGSALDERAEAILSRYGGTVVARETDHIVALFGLGDPDGLDTETATRCALVALRALDGPSRPSAGIHTGKVHVSARGVASDDERLRALVVAARDLARVREGRVAISVAATRHVKGKFDMESATSESRDVPVAGFLVKDVVRPQQAFGRFVGRRDELRYVGTVLAEATRRSARLLTIRGDHGIGKTRLLVEVERRLRRGSYNVGLHIVPCPPRGRELPLSGIASMLQVLCGVADGDSPERIQAVKPRLRALGLTSEEVSVVLATVGGGSIPTSGSAHSVLRNAVTRMVASLCEDRPHAFAWDSAHQLDDASFDLLRVALGKLNHVRVVFIFASRAGFSHGLERHPAHSSLELVELLAEDAERLVALRLGVDRVPDELLRFVRERAGGHPQFIEEVLKGLVDARAVTIASGKIVSMKLVGQELALPKTLRGLVASRVARLTADARGVLQACAVLGDPIDLVVLALMLGQTLPAIERVVALLKERDFLVPAGPSTMRFASPIVREVVVDALTVEAAREMHSVAGLAIERIHERAQSSELAARIATHFYEAGDRTRAAHHFAKSAALHLEAKQLESAARAYARAIDLADTESTSADDLVAWLGGLASAVRLVRSTPEAPEMCERVIARVDKAGTVEARVRVRIDSGRILSALHQYDSALHRFDEAEMMADGRDDLVRLALSAASELSSRQGDFKRAQELLTRLQALATASGDRQEEHKILSSLAQARAAAGDKKQAISSLERAEKLLPGDAVAAAERQKRLGLVEYFSRDFRSAALAFERAADMARDVSIVYEIAVNLHNLGDTLVRLDDYARAYGAFQQSLLHCDESGFERLGSLNRMFLAYLDAVQGEVGAQDLVEQAVRYAEANEFRWDEVSGRALLAALHARKGNVREARSEYERLAEVARETGNRLAAEDAASALAALPAS
ncbi:MAG: protein kinase [Polyangiaceae bacterium]